MAGVTGMGSVKKVSTPSDELNIQPPSGMSFEAPTGQYVENAPPPQARPSLDDIFASGETVAAKPSLEEIFGGASPVAPEEEFTDEPIGMMEELGNFPARAKASFQVSDKEIQTSLEQSFGKDKVRNKDGTIQYKAKDNKWREWDAGTEISDFTTDLIRPAVEEIPASIATLAASVPAVASMIASAGLSTPVSLGGVAAARAGGAMLGQATADLLQGLTGVPRDEDRSALLEYGLTAVLSPASGMLADYATKSIAKRAAKSQAMKLMTPADLNKVEIEGIQESIDVVKGLGGLENIPGTDTPLILSQLIPSNETARELTEKASGLNGYKQVIEQISQGFENSSKAFMRMLGSEAPKKTGEQFRNYVKTAIKQEGEAIGAVRDGLIEAAGNGELPIPKLKAKLESFATDLGFQVGGNNNLAGLKDFLVNEKAFSKNAAEVIVNKTNRMLEKVTNKEGRLTAKELVGLYEEMNGLYKNVVDGGVESSSLYRRKVGEMRRFFADELADKVEVIADKNAKSSYMGNLTKYRELVTASEEFSKLLDKNTLASHSLSKAIFSKGADGLDSLNAAKALLRDSPELWEDVKGSYIQQVVADNFNQATKKTNWTAVNKQIQSLGPEMLEAAFGKEGAAGLKAYQAVGKAIEDGTVGASNSANRALFHKNVFSAIFSKLATGNAIIESLKQMNGASAFAEIISKEGIDNFMKTAPKDAKPMLKQIYGGFVTAAQRIAQISELPLRRTGKGASKNRANEENQP